MSLWGSTFTLKSVGLIVKVISYGWIRNLGKHVLPLVKMLAKPLELLQSSEVSSLDCYINF